MKKAIMFALILLGGLKIHAQPTSVVQGIDISELPIIYLNAEVSVHFVSPEPIQYVDISTKEIIGDLPVKNVLRLKFAPDPKDPLNIKNAVITITGEKFIAQYHIIYGKSITQTVQTKIDILPEHMKSLDVSGVKLSEREMKVHAMSLISKKTNGHWAQSKAFGITARLNSVYTLDDYIFLDLGYFNATNLRYDIDEVRFNIEDRKVTKASTVQSIEIKPDYILFPHNAFKTRSRNIYVFKKFSFPGNKILKVEMSEKQPSGRVNTLYVKYGDILDADIIPTN